MSIEAMKQALDYMQSDLAGRIKKKPHAIASLRQAIEQAEKQEPVAMVGSGHQLLWTGVATYADHARQHGIKVGSLLYTDPTPQREWVALTDEEIESLWDHGMYIHCSGITALRAITRTIEAKLKELNHVN